jgi:hypothetical protein
LCVLLFGSVAKGDSRARSPLEALPAAFFPIQRQRLFGVHDARGPFVVDTRAPRLLRLLLRSFRTHLYFVFFWGDWVQARAAERRGSDAGGGTGGGSGSGDGGDDDDDAASEVPVAVSVRDAVAGAGVGTEARALLWTAVGQPWPPQPAGTLEPLAAAAAVPLLELTRCLGCKR